MAIRVARLCWVRVPCDERLVGYSFPIPFRSFELFFPADTRV